MANAGNHGDDRVAVLASLVKLFDRGEDVEFRGF